MDSGNQGESIKRSFAHESVKKLTIDWFLDFKGIPKWMTMVKVQEEDMWREPQVLTTIQGKNLKLNCFFLQSD